MSHHPNDSPRQSQVQVEDRNAKLVTRQIVIFVLQGMRAVVLCIPFKELAELLFLESVSA